MNLTRKLLRDIISDDEFNEVTTLLEVERCMNYISFYSGFFIALLNLIILVLSILIHLKSKRNRPAILLIGNLAFTNFISPLICSLASMATISMELSHTLEHRYV